MSQTSQMALSLVVSVSATLLICCCSSLKLQPGSCKQSADGTHAETLFLFPPDPPGFGVRSFGGAPTRSYEVQFPLARPSSGKLQAICLHSERRPRYPQSYFPRSGFGQLKRRGSAVNRAETWFTTCCQNNETWPMELTLCCVTKAVSLSRLPDIKCGRRDANYRLIN